MKWRLLVDGRQDAATNMAVDEALFLTVSAARSLPTVRLYGWIRPSLSIGYRQCLHEACDDSACRELGVDVVRRISGGRAVLHQDELTYCVAAPADGPLQGLSVGEIYLWVTGAIRHALTSLEIHVDPPAEGRFKPRSQEAPGHLPCFAVPTGHEITAGGKKLVGSAQKRGRNGFMQHGSVLLKLDASLWRRATGLGRDADLGAVSLSELAKRPVGEAELGGALQEGFRSLFGEPEAARDLCPAEEALARRLAVSKYASESWNRDRRFPTLLG